MTEKRQKNPEKSPKKPTPERKGKAQLMVYLERELRAALDAMVKGSRRSLTAEVSIALEEYLAKHDRWPPPESSK